MSRTSLVVIIATTSLLVGGALGYLFGETTTKKIYDQELSEIHPVRNTDKAFPLINPLLTYDLPQSRFIREEVDMKAHLEQVIDRIKREGDTSEISVYFKQLGSGKWFGISENKSYSPASLLKVILMISYYKKIEDDLSFTKHQLSYTPKIAKMNTILPYASTSLLTINEKYLPEDLVKRMIVSSDNGALNTLYANIGAHEIDEVFTDLGIPSPEGTQGVYTISAKQYSLFFRVLYNGTYLSRDHSNSALKFLSEAEFGTALSAGVPQETIVAHKYGEHLEVGGNNQITAVEIHDCGIVYASDSPYFLCVMTSGSDLSKQMQAIATISSDVYASLSKVPGKEYVP